MAAARAAKKALREAHRGRQEALTTALRSGDVGTQGPRTVGDPTDRSPDPERLMAVADAGRWADQPRELAEVLWLAGWIDRGIENAVPADASGVGSGGPERLTTTLEEAAAALGIRRAFAYEAARFGWRRPAGRKGAGEACSSGNVPLQRPFRCRSEHRHDREHSLVQSRSL